MALKSTLIDASVYHIRHVPFTHKLHHKVCFLNLVLGELSDFDSLKALSINHFNLFSFYEKDHGLPSSRSLEEIIPLKLSELQAPFTVAELRLITLPRVLGYVFNPVSFWLCYDEAGQLRCVFSEVNNTFGERHVYICFEATFHTITKEQTLKCEKVFHVSPFQDVKGHYEFKFDINDQTIAIRIIYWHKDEKLLTTGIKGSIQPLRDRTLVRYFFRYPFMTLKVIFMIHYHALRLWLKGATFYSKPTPPDQEITS